MGVGLQRPRQVDDLINNLGGRFLMDMRLGHVLVRKGLLDNDQIDRALKEQKRTGVPFGVACERLYGLDPTVIEQAWADQYATITQRVCLHEERIDPEALMRLTRRQAWQFGAIPLRWEGADFIVATCPELLVRAHRFVTRAVGCPVIFVMTDRDDLHAALDRAYPLPGAVLPSDDQPRGRTAA